MKGKELKLGGEKIQCAPTPFIIPAIGILGGLFTDDFKVADELAAVMGYLLQTCQTGQTGLYI